VTVTHSVISLALLSTLETITLQTEISHTLLGRTIVREVLCFVRDVFFSSANFFPRSLDRSP